MAYFFMLERLRMSAKFCGDFMENNERWKNPAAVYLGRLGGKKGGPARAAKLSATRRREIAQQAALSRWSKHNVREDEDSDDNEHV